MPIRILDPSTAVHPMARLSVNSRIQHAMILAGCVTLLIPLLWLGFMLAIATLMGSHSFFGGLLLLGVWFLYIAAVGALVWRGSRSLMVVLRGERKSAGAAGLEAGNGVGNGGDAESLNYLDEEDWAGADEDAVEGPPPAYRD